MSRTESDSIGSIEVPTNRYWGAQTQRSLQNFPIGSEKFPSEFVQALGLVKRACAETNAQLGLLPQHLAETIAAAAQEVADGKLNDHFPLVVWQTGSGTQTNMNANEVISNRSIEMLGGVMGSKEPVHPNDHVNRSQSSNDVIPTVMHVAAVTAVTLNLIPSLTFLAEGLEAKEVEFAGVVKTGRTHLQDATPVRLGQEFSGYASQVRKGVKRIEEALDSLYELALGGSAVGTGLNTHEEWSEEVARAIARLTNQPFRSAMNKFEAMAAHDAIVEMSGALKVVAVGLMKIANDIRWLGSGPRTGIGELILPANEPGSSIMPGKVNPTQAEAVTQVAVQVMGNDTTIGVAGSQGNFELNVYKPVMIYNLLQSIQLLADVARSFRTRCVDGIRPNEEVIKRNVSQSLMLVTALSPLVGYDKAAWVAKTAYQTGKTLKQVVLEANLLSEAEVDAALDPAKMTQPDQTT